MKKTLTARLADSIAHGIQSGDDISQIVERVRNIYSAELRRRRLATACGCGHAESNHVYPDDHRCVVGDCACRRFERPK